MSKSSKNVPPDAPEPSIKEHELVAKLVADPASLPDLAVVAGYVGRSENSGAIRIYLTPELQSYYEVQTAGIVHRLDPNPSDSPLTPSYLWLKRDTDLTLKSRGQPDTKASFLTGAIQQQYSPQAPVVGPTGILYCTAAPVYCGNTAWPPCPTGPIGPTGIHYCTMAPQLCGGAA